MTGDKETRRQGDKETRRQGDKETRRQAAAVAAAPRFSLSPPLLVSLSALIVGSSTENMRFALTGNDRVALCVARAVALHPDHRLVRQVASAHGHSTPLLAAGVTHCQSWEDLLVDPEVDAVIVGEEGEQGRQAVRQLAQAGKFVLFGPDLTQPAEFFYELALMEGESPGRLFPLLAARAHPAVLELGEMLDRQELGRLRHVRLERRIAANPDGASLLSESVIERALLEDADLLRILCGDYDQVTALRSGDVEQGYSLANVTLGGPKVPQAVWAAAAGASDEWRLTLTGEGRSALLEGDPDAGRLRLTVDGAQETISLEDVEDDPGEWLLEAFVASVAVEGNAERQEGPEDKERGRGGDKESGLTPSLWRELARSVELVEAVERSVRRRRTIDVHFESPSERGMFKTQMTAVGCSLLIFTLLGVVVYLIAAAAIPFPAWLKQLMVALIFLPLGIFLAAQLLLFVTRPAGRG